MCVCTCLCVSVRERERESERARERQRQPFFRFCSFPLSPGEQSEAGVSESRTADVCRPERRNSTKTRVCTERRRESRSASIKGTSKNISKEKKQFVFEAKKIELEKKKVQS